MSVLTCWSWIATWRKTAKSSSHTTKISVASPDDQSESPTRCSRSLSSIGRVLHEFIHKFHASARTACTFCVFCTQNNASYYSLLHITRNVPDFVTWTCESAVSARIKSRIKSFQLQRILLIKSVTTNEAKETYRTTLVLNTIVKHIKLPPYDHS